MAEIKSGTLITSFLSVFRRNCMLLMYSGLVFVLYTNSFLYFFLWPFTRMPSHMHVEWTVGCARKINDVTMMPHEMSLTETVTEFTSLSCRVPSV